MPRWWRELAAAGAFFVLAVVTSPDVRADSSDINSNAPVNDVTAANAVAVANAETSAAVAGVEVAESTRRDALSSVADAGADAVSEQLGADANLSAEEASAADSTGNEAADLPAWRALNPAYSAPTSLPVSGKAMYYNPGVMDTVLESRLKYDQIEPCERCIGYVAMLRYGDLNRKIWLQMGTQRLEGPFHVIDAAATQHVGQLLAREWVVDVDYQTALRWGMRMPLVTIWEDPPLDLLLETWSLPLDWYATVAPAQSFTGLPQSRDVAPQHLENGHTATKQVIQLRDRNMRSYVDLAANLPLDLYVK